MANGRDFERSRSDYTVACICPKDVEFAPVRGMLDRIHGFPAKRDPREPASRPINGQNAYEFGAIGDHNVVVAIMPGTGNNIAAVVATQLLHDFPSIRFGLLVGIGGGVPSPTDDIRLGDVVVSQPSDTHGGVIQYDLGKRLPHGGFQRVGQLDKPPRVLLANVQRLRAQHRMAGNRIQEHLSSMLEKWPHMREEYSIPDATDQLFQADYHHQSDPMCRECSLDHLVPRPERTTNSPRIHYGNIGSANIVVRDPLIRDSIKNDGTHVLCVEMEAAGLMDSFPSLVVRGIADYADSHKNDRWQPYAAAAAAAYVKEFLLNTPAAEIFNEEQAVEVVNHFQSSTSQTQHEPNVHSSQYLSATSQAAHASLDTLTEQLQHTSLNQPLPSSSNYQGQSTLGQQHPYQADSSGANQIWTSHVDNSQANHGYHGHMPTSGEANAWHGHGQQFSSPQYQHPAHTPQQQYWNAGFSNYNSNEPHHVYDHSSQPPQYPSWQNSQAPYSSTSQPYYNGQYDAQYSQPPLQNYPMTVSSSYQPHAQHNSHSSYVNETTYQAPQMGTYWHGSNSVAATAPEGPTTSASMYAHDGQSSTLTDPTRIDESTSPGLRSLLIIQCEQHGESQYTKYNAFPNEDLEFKLKEKCTVIVADNSDDALDVFEQPHADLLAVYFYEYNYRRRRERQFAIDRQLMEAVLRFVQAGGIVLINGHNIESDFEPFFEYDVRLPWKMSQSSSGFDLIRNRKFNARTFSGDEVMPVRWTPNQVALVRNVDTTDLLFTAESPTACDNPETEGPVAVKRFGKGFVCWYGISCNKEPSQRILFALFGLTWG